MSILNQLKEDLKVIFLSDTKCKINFEYGRKSADHTEPDFDVIFLGFLRPFYGGLYFCLDHSSIKGLLKVDTFYPFLHICSDSEPFLRLILPSFGFLCRIMNTQCYPA